MDPGGDGVPPGEGGADAAAGLRRCSAAARWLPRVIGGSVIAAAAIASSGVGVDSTFATRIRAVVWLGGGAAALWFVRAGSELRMEVGVGAGKVRMGFGGRFLELPVSDLDAVDYDPPFASARAWPPAVVLLDDRERRYRIPALLQDGPGWLEQILALSGRERLRAWAEARRIARRMVLSRLIVPGGYLAAAALVAGAAAFAWA